MNITILYSCHGCDIIKRSISVPARENENVKDWLDCTMKSIADDHRKISPDCFSELADIMVPISGVNKIGEVAKQ